MPNDQRYMCNTTDIVCMKLETLSCLIADMITNNSSVNIIQEISLKL